MEAGIIFFVVLAVYLLPALIASGRKHRNANSIFIVNAFLGWLVIPWVLTLAWAFSANVRGARA